MECSAFSNGARGKTLGSPTAKLQRKEKTGSNVGWCLRKDRRVTSSSQYSKMRTKVFTNGIPNKDPEINEGLKRLWQEAEKGGSWLKHSDK